jgi:hypothetical protein
MTATTGEIPLLNGKASVYSRLLLFKKKQIVIVRVRPACKHFHSKPPASIAPNALTMATLVENTARAHGVARADPAITQTPH